MHMKLPAEGLKKKPLANEFWHREFLNRTNELIESKNYENLARLGGFLITPFPNTTAKSMFSAIFDSYEPFNNNFEAVCAFCERARSNTQGPLCRSIYHIYHEFLTKMEMDHDQKISTSATMHLNKLKRNPSLNITSRRDF